MSDMPAPETRPSLLRRLQDAADQDAWREFERRYGPKIHGWCRRWGLQEADVEDVSQQVLLKLIEKMRDFVYDPARSFRAWLKTLAQRTWSDFVRRRPAPAEGGGTDEVAALLGRVESRQDLAGRLEGQFDLDLLEEACCRVRRRVAERTWGAWQGLAVEGLPVAEVAGRTGLKVEQVYVARRRVQKLLRAEVRRLEG
jgi:RNA polymerase sigma-70 factor (ECF subfamily)